MTAPVVKLSPESVARAALTIIQGGLVVVPTDTVYGIACNPFEVDCVARLFEAKRREGKPIPVLCETYARAVELVRLGPKGEEVAKKFWPGPLTIVAPLRKDVPQLLHQGTGNLGVRVPGHDLLIEVIAQSGGFVTGTSANISGSPASRTADEARRQLGGAVDLILDGGRLAGLESTVIRVDGDSISVLRQGRVGVTDTS